MTSVFRSPGQPRWALPVIMDLAIVALAYSLATYLRYAGEIPDFYHPGIAVFLPVAMAVHLLVNALAGIYKAVNRSTGRGLVLPTLNASLVTMLALSIAVVVWPSPARPVPLSVVVVGGVLTMLLMMATHLLLARQVSQQPD